MDTKGYVVIVDAFAPARFFPPEFHEAGYACVRVQSTPEIPPAFAGSLGLTLYADNIVHTGDLEETARAAGAYEPVAVFAGSEFGVEFADRLSEAMGLPTNGTELSAARRDKFTMIETIKAAGVRGARQLLATSADELARWHTELGTRVVVKPLKSAGNDGVRFCATPRRARPPSSNSPARKISSASATRASSPRNISSAASTWSTPSVATASTMSPTSSPPPAFP